MGDPLAVGRLVGLEALARVLLVGEADKALARSLLADREPPLRILAMVARQLPAS
jgi:hypothetical protein